MEVFQAIPFSAESTQLIEDRQMGRPVKLNSHDINVLSVIAQKRTLPREYLLQLAKTSQISADALLVVRSLLKSPSEPLSIGKISVKKRKSEMANQRSVSLKRAVAKKAAIKKVAGDFRKWATSVK
jgi:hypothetical protein